MITIDPILKGVAKTFVSKEGVAIVALSLFMIGSIHVLAYICQMLDK